MSGLFYFVHECFFPGMFCPRMFLSGNVFVRELRELCELKKKKLV